MIVDVLVRDSDLLWILLLSPMNASIRRPVKAGGSLLDEFRRGTDERLEAPIEDPLRDEVSETLLEMYMRPMS